MVFVTQVNTQTNYTPQKELENPALDRCPRARDRADVEFFSLPDVSGDSKDAADTNYYVIPEAGPSENPDPYSDDRPTALKRALKLKQQGNLQKAEEMFRHAMNLHPNNVDVLFHYGEFLMANRNDFEKAYAYYLKALQSTDNSQKSPTRRKLKEILPLVNSLDLTIVNRVNSKLSEINSLSKEDPTFKRFMEEINLEHIHRPASTTILQLPLRKRTVAEDMNAESENSCSEKNVIAGINKAIMHVMAILINSTPITVEVIKDIHKLAMEPCCAGIAGRFREIQVYVSRHTPPAPSDVKDLMDDFIAILEDPRTKNKHPLHIAAYAHCKLVNIHPFEDGNKRVARFLMNLILRKYKYPPILIKEWDEYGEHLQTAQQGDIRPFLRFVAQIAESTIDDYLRNVNGNNSPKTPECSGNFRGRPGLKCMRYSRSF